MSHSQLTGQGWAFPVSFTRPGQSVVMVTGDEDIRQSLHILLATATGERAMRPEWGSPLSNYHFAEMDTNTTSFLSEQISDAIVKHERRVELHSVDVDTGLAAEGLLLIQISYTIRQTNTRDNMVYPFYLRENRV